VLQSAINLSEGRDPQLLERVRACLGKIPGACLADLSMDPDHHRMVASLLGSPGALREAVLRLFELADQSIDLRRHSGVHPRVGAIDVVPFVALGTTPPEVANELAAEVAEAVANRFEVPVILYELSARRPENVALPDLRRGGLEGAARRLQDIPPDFGPARLHPRLGLTVMGARPALVAFNLVLGSGDLNLAKKLAAALRGYPGVRALGLWLESRERAQVSVNLTRPAEFGMLQAFQTVEQGAREAGGSIESCELIGLAPARAFSDIARHFLKLEGLQPSQLLESNLLSWRPDAPS